MDTRTLSPLPPTLQQRSMPPYQACHRGGLIIIVLLRRFTHWLHLEPLLAVILWGGVYPGAKLGLRDIPVLHFTALRLLVAALLCYVVLQQRQVWRLPPALWPALLRAGLAQTVFQLTLVASLRWTTAGHSAVLLATAPLLTSGWLAATGQSVLGRRQLVGVLLGLLGVGCLVHDGALTFVPAQLAGDGLALGAAGAWAWYGLVIGPLVGRLGATQATGWTMAIAAGTFLPLAWLLEGNLPWQHISWSAWAGLFYGASVGMVLAMTLWGKAMHRFGPQQTMLYVYLEPVSAVVIAALLLGEVWHPLQAAGALITILGVALASSRSCPSMS